MGHQKSTAAWTALHLRCRWSHPCQKPEFVRTWYQSYLSAYDPLIVVREGADGDLLGLLPLARERATGQLVPAGRYDAEYHGWLAVAELAEAFPAAALAAVMRQHARGRLVLRYLPPGTPVDWLRRETSLSFNLEAWRRPLMRVDTERAERAMQRSTNRNRINRLQRLGAWQFSRAENLMEAARTIDCLADYVDFRHGALHGICPFGRDPLRKSFLLQLFRAGLLHITGLWVGDMLLSGQLNVSDGRELTLHTVGHSPLHPRLSAGSMHMLHLIKLAAREGVARIDLTPGGDAYKEELADEHDEVQMLTLFSSRAGYAAQATVRATEAVARRVVRQVGVEPATVREEWRRLRHGGPLRGLRRAAAGVAEYVRPRRKWRIYRGPRQNLPPGESDKGVDCDSIVDLLQDPPSGEWANRRAFLIQATKLLERECHVYTICTERHIEALGWSVMQSSRTQECPSCQGFSLPQDSACLFGFSGKSERFKLLVHRMLEDLHQRGVQQVFACMEDGDRGMNRQLEAMGFVQIGTVLEAGSFGRVRRRQQWLEGEPSILAARTRIVAATPRAKQRRTAAVE